MQLSKHLGDRHFWGNAMRLAIPISLQNILVSSFALVDTIMVGALGSTALASVGMAGQWSWLLNLVLFGFNSGASVFIAQFWGIRDESSIRKSFGLAVVSALSASMVFTVIGLAAPGMVLRFFTQDAEVIELGVSYLRLAAFSYVAICLNNLFGTILRSTENVRLPLYASMVSVAANAVLNALLIYGLKMGVRGAALATAISSWISPILLFVLSMRQHNILRAPIKAFLGWSRTFAASFYRISLPVLLNETLWAMGTLGYKSIYSNASKDFYAAYTIFSSVEGLAFAFFVGLCHACAVLVGKLVGAGELKTAYRDACRFTIAMPLLTLCVSMLVMAIRPVILLPFGNVEAETLATASTILLIYLLEIPIRNIPYISIVGIFRSGGDTRCGLIYDLGCLWMIALPVTYIGANVLHLPLTTVFLLMLLSEDLIKSTLCIRRLVSKKWIRPVTGESVPQTGDADPDSSSIQT